MFIVAYDITCGRIFTHSHAVSKAPAEHFPVRILHGIPALEELIDLEDTNLASRRADIDSGLINIAIGASRYKQQMGVVLRNQESTRDVVCLIHARDDMLWLSHRAFRYVVIISINIGGGRGKKDLSIR